MDFDVGLANVDVLLGLSPEKNLQDLFRPEVTAAEVMCTAFFAGDLEKAKKLHFGLCPLFRGAFLETNPVPTKMTLAWMGRIPFETRLPLVEMEPKNQAKLKDILTAAGLL